MITGTASSDTITLIRKANKLINLWIEKELPYIHSNIVKTAIDINQQKLQEEANPSWLNANRADNQYVKTMYEELADTIENDPDFDLIKWKEQKSTFRESRAPARPDSEITQEALITLKKIRAAIEFNEALSEEEKQQQRTAWLKHYRIMSARNNSLINSDSRFDFSLHLFPEYRNDDDVIIDEKYLAQSSAESLRKIIHDIKKHIEVTSQDNFIYLFNINFLLMKVTLLLPFLRLEDDSAQDFSMLEKWARIGSLLIDKSKNYQECCVQREVTEKITATFYGNIAYHVSHTSKKENLFAHSYLEICLAFKEMHKEYLERLRLCTLARIALNDSEISLALEHVEKAYAEYKMPILFLIEMLYCVGKAYANLNKEITVKCYRRAIALIEAKKNDGGFHQVDEPNVDAHAMTTFLNQYRAAIIETLKKEFNDIKVTVRNNKINVFLRFKKLPRTQIRLSKSSPISLLQTFSNYASKDKKLTGYGFILSDENYDESIHAVRDFAKKISKCFESEDNRKTTFAITSTKEALVLEPVIASIKNMSVKDVGSTPNMQDGTSTENEAVINNNQKHKSSTTTTTTTTTISTTTTPVIRPKPVIKRTANDYGFSVLSRRPVTPLYFSCAHKESGRSAQIVVCWDDSNANDMDPVIVDKFKDLFNPQGVVQTRKTNESGFKILVGKKNEWIVRGKLKGVGGSTRVYFKPTQTVTNEDKSTTTLCVLHKKMSK